MTLQDYDAFLRGKMRGWRHWRDFVSADDTGSVGRGCGEHDDGAPKGER